MNKPSKKRVLLKDQHRIDLSQFKVHSDVGGDADNMLYDFDELQKVLDEAEQVRLYTEQHKDPKIFLMP